MPAFIVWAADDTFLYNEALAALIGLPTAATGDELATAVLASLGEELAALVQASLAGEVVVQRRVPLGACLQQGSLRVSRAVSLTPLRESVGGIRGVFGVCNDAAEHLERERELRDSAARYRMLFDSIDEGFCIIQFVDGPAGPLSDYIHAQANAACAVNTGIPNLLGQRVREVVPEEAAGWIELLVKVLKTGQPIRFERELIATGRCLELAAFRVEPPSRCEVAVLFKDVTARKRAERALQELNETLEARVAAALAERLGEQELLRQTEDALRQAQKMEAVGQLTGGLAHDFNNLLAGISGAFQMIGVRLAQGRTHDVDRYLEVGQGAARRAASLTHRLLAFSRRQTLAPKAIVINRLMADLVELTRRTVGPAIEVQAIESRGLWPTMVDPNQLENALLNLCINSRDAMPAGGKITIETANTWLDVDAAREQHAEPGQYITVCVTDTGVGIEKELLDRVFEPFFTTKSAGQGTGLGLSMVYGFARQSNGHVHIRSQVGKGTSVCIYLPRCMGEEDIDDAGAALPEPKSVTDAVVLIVDDEPTVCMLVRDALGDLNYTCIEAADGPSGLQILQSGQRVDLLITDVGLPGGLNGGQVADAAQALRPGLKVLFITGYAEHAVLNHGHIRPGMELLTKPFAIDDLGRRVERLLSRA